MKRYFFYHQCTDDFKCFESEEERNQNLLEYIDKHCMEDGIYDTDIISDIKIGIITHKPKYIITDKLENYEYKEDWIYSCNTEVAGVYKLIKLNNPI
jgi:hypothetical protein